MVSSLTWPSNTSTPCYDLRYLSYLRGLHKVVNAVNKHKIPNLELCTRGAVGVALEQIVRPKN